MHGEFTPGMRIRLACCSVQMIASRTDSGSIEAACAAVSQHAAPTASANREMCAITSLPSGGLEMGRHAGRMAFTRHDDTSWSIGPVYHPWGARQPSDSATDAGAHLTPRGNDARDAIGRRDRFSQVTTYLQNGL